MGPARHDSHSAIHNIYPDQQSLVNWWKREVSKVVFFVRGVKWSKRWPLYPQDGQISIKGVLWRHSVHVSDAAAYKVIICDGQFFIVSDSSQGIVEQAVQNGVFIPRQADGGLTKDDALIKDN